MTDTVRVVVADDQTAIREALATVLDLMPDLSVVAIAADGGEAVDAVEQHHPDVVLMDVNMPGIGGIEATQTITDRFPDVAVVVLTTFADEESILAALGAGARGYLTKQSGRQDIARAIHAAAAGQAVLDPAVQLRLVRAAASPARPAPLPVPSGLTPREIEVLTMIGQGLSNRAIAKAMFVSETTVKTHINHLFAKAALTNRAEAARFAHAHGLIS